MQSIPGPRPACTHVRVNLSLVGVQVHLGPERLDQLRPELARAAEPRKRGEAWMAQAHPGQAQPVPKLFSTPFFCRPSSCPSAP